MEQRYETRAEARSRSANPPTIVVHESRSATETARYLASLEASIDALRDWTTKYADLIGDEKALRELEDIVSSSSERHLTARESEVRRDTLRQAATLLMEAAQGTEAAKLERAGEGS